MKVVNDRKKYIKHVNKKQTNKSKNIEEKLKVKVEDSNVGPVIMKLAWHFGGKEQHMHT